MDVPQKYLHTAFAVSYCRCIFCKCFHTQGVFRTFFVFTYNISNVYFFGMFVVAKKYFRLYALYFWLKKSMCLVMCLDV